MHGRIHGGLYEFPILCGILGHMLRKHLRSNSNEKASLSQQSLFVALSFKEMIVLSHLLFILHIAVCMLFRWLAGKTHELKDYGSAFG
jgi:hypothetical protein